MSHAIPKPRTSRPTAILTALALVGSAFVVVGFLPAAAAHTCQASDPAENCGSCPSGNHVHTDNSGNVYCKSSDPNPPSEPQCGLKSVEQILACLKDVTFDLVP